MVVWRIALTALAVGLGLAGAVETVAAEGEPPRVVLVQTSGVGADRQTTVVSSQNPSVRVVDSAAGAAASQRPEAVLGQQASRPAPAARPAPAGARQPRQPRQPRRASPDRRASRRPTCAACRARSAGPSRAAWSRATRSCSTRSRSAGWPVSATSTRPGWRADWPAASTSRWRRRPRRGVRCAGRDDRAAAAALAARPAGSDRPDRPGRGALRAELAGPPALRRAGRTASAGHQPRPRRRRAAQTRRALPRVPPTPRGPTRWRSRRDRRRAASLPGARR